MRFLGPIARSTIRTSFVLGLRLLVQAGTLLLVARLLGPQQLGAFAGLAAMAVILGTLSTFGSHLLLLGAVSKDAARRAEVLPYAIPCTLICGSGLLALYLLTSRLALPDVRVPGVALAVIGATEILLQPLFGLAAIEHLALGRIARSQLLTLLPLALRLAAAASIALLRPSEPLAAYAYGCLVASCVALAIAKATMPAPWPTPSAWRFPSKTELREAAGYAALAITATSPAELDKTLAARLLPLSEGGLYTAGARVIGAAILPVMAMMLSTLPRLFRDGRDHPERTARLLRWIFAASLAYSIALAVVLWFAAPAVVWLFGEKYDGIQLTLRWLCLAVPGMALRIAAGSVLMALGKPWARAGFEVGGLIILIFAAVALTPRFNAAGMPIALACSEWGMAVAGYFLLLVKR